MKTVHVTICSDPETIGPEAGNSELFSYGNNLAKLLEREFSCRIHLHFGSDPESTSDDQKIRERIRAIETSDEWRKLLP